MFTYFRSRLGAPGLVATAALVFAMVGGAVAANDGSDGQQASASAKKGKKGPRGPRGFKGATGAAGPAGPAGPAGAKGDAGSAGTAGDKGSTGPTGPTGPTGTTGADGKSVVVDPIAAEGFECEGRAGANVRLEGELPEDGIEVCEGKVGEPWPLGGTVPVNATLKGTWAFTGTTADTEGVYTPITFSIPRAGGATLTTVHWSEEANFTDFDEGGPETIGCGVSANDPKAPSGHLCVYKSTLTNATFNNILVLSTATKGVSRTGAVLKFDMTGVGFGTGSWAFTG